MLGASRQAAHAARAAAVVAEGRRHPGVRSLTYNRDIIRVTGVRCPLRGSDGALNLVRA